MSCYICGRGSCVPSFHSLDEQRLFERAEEAYERFIEIRDECRQELEDLDEEECDEDEDT